MEMGYRNTIKDLEKVPYLNRKNLELLLGSNRRTLDDRIKSLINKGVLIKLKNGFYIPQLYLEKETEKEKYIEFLANILYQPSYVSLEYAMSYYGLIPENIYGITSVTLGKPRLYETDIGIFKYRNINKKLFDGFFTKEHGTFNVSFATKEKSLFDFLYYASLKIGTKDFKKYVKEDARINWDNLSKEEIKSLFSWINKAKMKKLEKIKKWI